MTEKKIPALYDGWEGYFSEIVEGFKSVPNTPVLIDDAPLLDCPEEENYFERYRNWKLRYHSELNYYYRQFTSSTRLLCAHCWPECAVEVFSPAAYDEEQKLFEYECEPDVTVCKCKFGHVFGEVIREYPGKKKPVVKADLKNFLMSCNFDSVEVFTGSESQKEKYLRFESESLLIKQEKSRIKKFECVICTELIEK